MDDFRSYAYGEGMQMEVYRGRGGGGGGGGRGGVPSSGVHHLRSYSTSYASSQQQPPKEIKFKRGKSISGASSSSSTSTKGNGWGLSDPEFQRKKRVATYKAYAVESKMKGSLRKSFKWLKDKYTKVVYGWW